MRKWESSSVGLCVPQGHSLRCLYLVLSHALHRVWHHIFWGKSERTKNKWLHELSGLLKVTEPFMVEPELRSPDPLVQGSLFQTQLGVGKVRWRHRHSMGPADCALPFSGRDPVWARQRLRALHKLTCYTFQLDSGNKQKPQVQIIPKCLRTTHLTSWLELHKSEESQDWDKEPAEIWILDMYLVSDSLSALSLTCWPRGPRDH